MQLRFFIGVEDKEVEPEKSSENAAKHYAWCLNRAINNLEQCKTDQDSKEVLQTFIADMNTSAATKKMIGLAESQLCGLINRSPLPPKQSLIEYLSGIPVAPGNDYLTYSTKNRRT